MKSHVKGKLSERSGARKYGGRTQPGSGSKWVAKGDFKVDEGARLLFQNKCTEKKSYSMKYDELEEIADQALVEDRAPVFRIDFYGRKPWVVMPEWYFKGLLDTVCDLQEVLSNVRG